MNHDKWPEVVAEFDRIEADIKAAMKRPEDRHMADMRRDLAVLRVLQKFRAYRDRIAAKVEAGK